MFTGQYDGGASASLFSGGGFMPSQATQTPESGFSKTRGSQTLLPVTVKQIREAYDSADGRSDLVIDGAEASTVRLLGRVVNKSERVIDVSFALDDGTGRIDIHRWMNETSDNNEVAVIENGMYVIIVGSLKGFQGKHHVLAFSVRPVTDFNYITYHFIECIHAHLENTKSKFQASGALGAATPVRDGPGQFQANAPLGTASALRNDVKGYQSSYPNQFSTNILGGGGSGPDILELVLNVFHEPASLAREHGLHVEEVIRRLGFPADKIRNAIDFHVQEGNIYSTIDDDHYKSACNG